MIKFQGERSFRALIEKSADAILLVDRRAHIIYANLAASDMLGYSPQTILGISILKLLHPNDKSHIERHLAQVAVGEDRTYELRFKRRSGSWLWLEGTITNLLQDPEIEGIYVNLRDISGRKEAQHHLQSQKDLLQNLVVVARATSEAVELREMVHNLLKIGKWLTLATNGSVFLFDQIGSVVFSSSYHGTLDPDHVHLLMQEGLSGWVIQHNRPALVTDTTTDERWLSFNINGYVPRSAIALPIYSGQILLAILILTHEKPGHFNTNHLKTLQAASGQMAMAMHNAQLYSDAQSNLADLNALIESSQDGIVLVNLDSKIRVINAAALKILGLTGKPSHWIGNSAIELFRQCRRTAPRLVKIMIGQYRRALAGENEIEEGECQIPAHYIHWLHTPVTIGSRTIGHLVVLRDITEQRKLEHQREDLTDMIVHDLRNPASAVAGIISMLKSVKDIDEIPEDYDQMVQLAERNVTKILDLVQELLDVSQLESGLLTIRKSPVHLETLIHETLQLQGPIISLKEISLEAKIQSDLPDVLADQRLIRRVLQNLVDNAAKFSHRNGNIIISAQVSTEDAGWVQVSVQDFGIGIPKALQNRVFEKFITNRHVERGSGIGLTFCRLAVLAHDGRIWVESEEDKGSTFYFTLPILDSRLR